MHRRLKNKLDVLNFSAYERIAHQVQQQELKELHARVKAIKKTRTKVEEMTVDELCDMLDAETECDESINVQKQLSKSMQRQVQAERDHRRQAINDKVRQKIGEESKKVKQLLKFRVVDAVDPKKTGIISWWSPTDELLDVIKVGRNLEIVNTAAGAPGKEIQISAGSSSSVKLIPRTKLPTTAAQFLRQETKIAEINENFKPANDEFDVACIVVRVETKTTNNYVKVYVVDEHREVLCINFFNSIEDYAYEDVVTEGQVMYVKNLQWRQTHTNEKPVQAFVSSDCTTFTIHPATEANKIRLQQLKEVLKHNPDFVQNCKQMFEVNKENHRVELNTSVSGPVFSKTLPSSRHLPYSKTPKTTSIGASTKKRLGMSGGPPRKLEMPKLDIRVVKPKFTKVQSYKQPSNSNRPNFKNSLKKSS